MSSTETTAATESAQRARADAAGQGHVFAHWDSLDAVARALLLEQLSAVNYAHAAKLAGFLTDSNHVSEAPTLTPPDLFPLERNATQREHATVATDIGAAHFAAGRVGFMIVAGGQGSRLGYNGPKGCFEIGPLTKRSLFAYHAARLCAAGARHGFTPVWYVMTSPMNEAATRAFFAEQDHFGLPESDVFFFSQAMLPAMDLDGKLLLNEAGSLFLAPNGHGGSLAALATSGALADMQRRGIETISFFQVDNPLARPGDELFVGLHRAAKAGMSSKVVSKRDAGEKVGVIGGVNGELGCIEYSDLSAELRDQRDSDGNLVFRAGNIAVHILEVDFVKQLTAGGDLDLPWHVARKNMRVFGSSDAVAGAKFETFVFDALAKSPNSVTLEVERHLEFSPVKNKDGADSADSCRADLTALFNTMAKSDGPIEIDPRFAEDATEFAARASNSYRDVNGGRLFEL